MSLTFGYRGPQVDGPKFSRNPLSCLPEVKVSLLDYEVVNACADMGIGDWEGLTTSQRREVARHVLNARIQAYPSDAEAGSWQAQLDLLGLNNPNFNIFEIIITGQLTDGQVDYAHHDFLSNFLL